MIADKRSKGQNDDGNRCRRDENYFFRITGRLLPVSMFTISII
jgi:hypothetical protein